MNKSIETALSDLGRILDSENGLSRENAGRLISDLKFIVYSLSQIMTFPTLGQYVNADSKRHSVFHFPDGSVLYRPVPRFTHSELKGIANLVFIQDRNLYSGWSIIHDGTLMISEIRVRDVGAEIPDTSGLKNCRFVVVDSARLSPSHESGLISIIPKSDNANLRYLIQNIISEIDKCVEMYLIRAEERISKAKEIRA